MLTPDDVPNFEALIADARLGKADAKERLLLASTEKIESWNRSWYDFLVQHRLSARDLTQDVLLVAGYSFAQFRGNTADAWFAWLFAIHRTVVGELRHRKDALTLAIPVDSGPTPGSSRIDFTSREMTPASWLSLREERERIQKILDRIDPRLRDALLYWMQGKTLEEQAKDMKTTVSKVRTLRFKALKEFSSQWKNLRESA